MSSRVIGLALLCCATAATAFAQDAPELRGNRLTVNAGVTWFGGYDVGRSSALLRGNATGATGPAFTLFAADSHLSTATAPEIRVSFSLTSRITLEGGASLSRPRVGISITGDAEAPPQELPGEQLQQYVFDGGLTWQLPLSLGRRMAPYVAAGGGHLRQLHQERTLAETGRIYYAGGGARYWLRGGRGATRPIGLRGEFRMNLRDRGIEFEDKKRAYPTASLFLFVGI